MSGPQMDPSLIVREELERHVRAIRDAFLHRPVPASAPRAEAVEDFRAFLVALTDKVSLALTDIVAAMGPLFPETPESPAGGRQEAARRLRSGVDDLIAAFREVWRRPWPPLYAGGQPLLSALVERPLRDLLGALEEVLSVLRLGSEAARECPATPHRIRLVFQADEEAEALTRWLRDVDQRLAAEAVAGRLRRIRPTWGTVLLAFLLGHWWGDDG